MKKTLVQLALILLTGTGFALDSTTIVYKSIDDIDLAMDIYYPDAFENSENLTAIVFFFGGGWKGGSTEQFKPQARYFAGRGAVCFIPNYRVSSRNNTKPFSSLKDAKSAIRFVRKNAKRYHIDPDKIVASGGSAGGHLAAATALVHDYNENNDDFFISCIPNALVLFNPVIDNGPGGYGYERIGNRYKKFSPLHNIHKGAPPTIFFLGTKDKLIPVETAQYYKVVMEKVGSRCDLHLYEGQEHGFFNYRNREYYQKTVAAADSFLVSLGFLK